MRWLVAAVTPPPPFSARDTEATETPASRATSLIVTVAMGAALGVLQINAGDNVIVFIEPCKAFAKEASVALRKVYANVFMDASGKRPPEREKRDGIARIALSRCSNPG